MDYELYHDESKVDGYWHGILLVPVLKRRLLLDLLQRARQNTNYAEPIGIKKIRKCNRIYDCADAWVQIGVAALMSQTKTQPYPIFLGCVKGKRQYCQFRMAIGAKFILFREYDDHGKMTGHMDYGSKVETTFRMGLKGGLHLLGNQSEGIDITRMHFDGYAHYQRHLDRHRVVERLQGLREYCSVSAEVDVIDDRSSNHKKAGCQDYNDCQILQLTDLLVGSLRAVLGPKPVNPLHGKIAQSVKAIIDRYEEGPARMLNSRWRGGFCISQCYLEAGSWKFEKIECTRPQEGKQLTMCLA